MGSVHGATAMTLFHASSAPRAGFSELRLAATGTASLQVVSNSRLSTKPSCPFDGPSQASGHWFVG